LRALVTGITGQDGSYLCERLLADGYEVHGLVQATDQASDGLVKSNPSIVLHEGDLRDGSRLAAVVAAADPDEIYNLGGVSSVALSWEDPALAGKTAGLAVASLLEAALQLQNRRDRSVRFVQAASAEIFGAASGPQDEQAAIRPTSPYGAAKAYAHHLVGVYRGAGLFATSLILFNHESPRRPPTFVTRKITQQVALIARGRADELALGNVHARRDWGWAPDYVDAMVRAAHAPAPDDFVVATGEAHTVLEFALAAFAHAGIEDGADRIRVDGELVRPADADALVGDATKARRVLGWRPTLSFEEIVGRMVEADLLLAVG
jgi:GDPmannose 4,6-dehydratase